MRNTIIIGSLLALVGFAAVAQASDPYEQATGHAPRRCSARSSNDSRGERHDRYERARAASRERHDETSERRARVA